MANQSPKPLKSFANLHPPIYNKQNHYSFMKTYKLELTVFIAGASVMMLEMTGSRILAPYLGSSTFTWTSLIGIILGSLSLGYYLGGKYSDKKPSYEKYSKILLVSGLLVFATTIAKQPILEWIQTNVSDIRLGSVYATIALFAIPSVMLGMISPYALRLKLKSIKNSGQTAGKLYALSTIGSIVGTFLAGFYLLSVIGSSSLLLLISALLIIAALIANHKSKLIWNIVALVTIAFYFIHTQKVEASSEIIELDSEYSHIKIYEDTDPYSLNPILKLVRNTNHSSAMFLDSNDLVFKYTKYYDLIEHFNPNLKKTLLIGGGAYSYPKHYLEKFPEASIDVVEIDPMLYTLSLQYFNLPESPFLTNYPEDGRTFLNNNEKKYDAILQDAFGGHHSIPFQLTTIEAAQEMYDSLEENGIFIANVISGIEGERGQPLRAIYHTFSNVFPQTYVLQVHPGHDKSKVQNLILIGLKSTTSANFETDNKSYSSFFQGLVKDDIPEDLPVLTDDFAPIDNYTMKLLAE
jgi:spermidine synthase